MSPVRPEGAEGPPARPGSDQRRWLSTRPTARHDSTDSTLAAEKRLPRLANEPTDRIAPAEPIEPTDRTDPTESIDSTDPRERIDSTEAVPDERADPGRIGPR